MSVAPRGVLAYETVLGRARVGLSLLSLELRRSLCLWLFPFMVVVLAWIVYDGLPAGIWLWTETVWSVQYSLIFFGPLVGGVSAWTAGRELRRDMADLLCTTSRPAVTRDLAVWAATTAWCGLAYAAVAAAFYLLTRANASWGSPEWGPAVTGLAAVVAHSSLGYAAGRHLPSRLTAPLFAVAMYWAQGIASFDIAPSVAHLSPLGSDIASTVFYDESPDTFLTQTVWLLGIAGVSLSAVALGRRRVPVYWVALALMTAVAAIAATMLVRAPAGVVDLRGDLRGTPVPYEPVCREGSITVCVHPAYEAALPETVETVGDLAAPLVGLPGAPDRAEQRPGDARIRRDGTLVYSLYGAFYRSNVDSGYGLRDYVQPEIANALVAGPSGYAEDASIAAYDRGDPCRRPGGPPGEAQRAVAAWLIYRVDTYDLTNRLAFAEATEGRLCPRSGAAIGRFDALSPAERRGWLRENYADLRAGKLTLDDLP